MTQDHLASEAELNAMLDAWRVPPPSAELIAAIVATAPQPRAASRWAGWLAPLGVGAGLAAACAAGLMVGVQVTRTTLDHNESVVAALDPTTVGEDV